MSKKLEKIARLYRIDLSKQQDQPSVATLPEGNPIVSNVQRQSEHERLKNEFQLAKQRLQEFVTRDKQSRIASRRGRA
jgi:hypothetical protein